MIMFSRGFYVMALFRSLLGHKTLEHKCSLCFVVRENAYGNLWFGIVWVPCFLKDGGGADINGRGVLGKKRSISGP